jgi:SAM-dependent methyltransferase
MYDAERNQGEAATDPAFERHADQWASRAKRYATAAQRDPQPDGFMQLLLPRLHPDDTVLDIGAGTGRYEPPLAGRVSQVIALEPSPAMRAQLEARVAAKQLTNVQVITDAWPAASAIQADVAISAHVVYGVRKLAPFVLAMDGAARRDCYLYLGLQHPAIVLAPFWERVHGEARLPLPAALEALNALHQLNLPASLELVPLTSFLRFADEEEAVADLMQRLRCGPQHESTIRAAIPELLLRQPDGSLTPLHHPRHAALLWWPAAQARAER